MTSYTATYSPDDNKLRLYTSSRLDTETYARAKELGFRWAPKQELFVAPTWTPQREDFLIELAGEVDDEDTSLVDRAEQRAERFEDYGEKRGIEAEQARKAVAAIADNIPFGQPILVGHHSEKHARKDAERIQSGMRRAIRLWETSGYWKSRAEGALRAAKYKELPGVRHRRIKGLNADKRRVEKNLALLRGSLAAWTALVEIAAEARDDAALRLANSTSSYELWSGLRDGKITTDEARAKKLESLPRAIAHTERWLAHYENRLAYEQAMLNEQIGESGEVGAGMAGRFDVKPGGKVLVGRAGWLVVIRVNKAAGIVNSVTTQAPPEVTWSKTWKYGIEKVVDYQPPTEEMAAKVKKATALPPICNYRVDGCKEMTQVEWAQAMKRKWSDFPYYGIVAATPTAGRHRVRQVPGGMMKRMHVFIADAKAVDPPQPEPKGVIDDNQTMGHRSSATTALCDSGNDLARGSSGVSPQGMRMAARSPADESGAAFDAMRQTLKAGVKVVAVPQLFSTPPDIAKRAVELAGIVAGDRVLEPSAGTGALIDAMNPCPNHDRPAELEIVERNIDLCVALRRKPLPSWAHVHCGDFLDLSDADIGTFDKIVMNPPFENGADIKHVEHALTFLRPGGRLVAIVAGGPRQQRAFEERAWHWQELPSGTFAGTGVRSILMAIDKEKQ